MKTRLAASAAPLRVGRARTALLAFLAAQSAGAPFILRHSGDAALPDLRWLGIEPNETHRLADHAPRHAAAVDRLRACGRLYPCFETDDELRWKREQRIRRNKAPLYDRAMLKLTAAQRASAEAGGKRPYWRFRLSDKEIGWRDLVAGHQQIKLTAISDPVVVAADGTVLAALAAAIDDAADAIGLLIRDITRIEASAVQLDMMAALGGGPLIRLAHLPPLPEAVAAIQVRRLRQNGVEANALATLLARPDAAAPVALADLARDFDLAASGRDVTSVTLDRLRALNRQALAALPAATVADRLPAGASEAFWLAVRGGIDLLNEAPHWWDVVGDDFLPPVIDAFPDVPEPPPEPWDASTWARWTAGMADPAKLRLALTGEEAGPDMAGLLPLIGRVRAERRLRLAA